MKNSVTLACKPQVQAIEVTSILPLRKIAPGLRNSAKYNQIASSIREVGIIEPLVVFPANDQSNRFLLLDGHLRLDILARSGTQSVECLVSTDDEAFTYNHKVNRLSAIQEHFMIMKALDNGVSEEDIARTLNVDVAKIRSKRDLLDGICPEAVELLKGRRPSVDALRQIRKVHPMRQIEMAELMCASNLFSGTYAKCLLAATPQDQLVESEMPKEVNALSTEDMARMEREMEQLSRDFRDIEEKHGKNVLDLVIVAGYLRKLLDNARVVRFLASQYCELMDEFQKIAETRSLSGSMDDIPESSGRPQDGRVV